MVYYPNSLWKIAFIVVGLISPFLTGSKNHSFLIKFSAFSPLLVGLILQILNISHQSNITV